MKFLTNHGEKLVCGVVVVLCAIWILQTLGSETAEKQKEIRDYQTTINGALAANEATDAFMYHPSKVATYSDDVKERLNGAETAVTGPVIARAFYPQPERPVVEAKVVVEKQTEIQEAVLLPFKGLSAEAQQGMVVLSCPQPDKVPNFVPVRIEVQRGSSSDKFEKDLVTSFELAPETVATAKTDDAGKKTDTTDVESADEKSGTTARTVRRTPSKAKPTKKEDKAKVKAPCRYEDGNVDSQVTYFYRARLVARLETVGPNNVIFRDGKEVTIVVPETVEKVKGKEEGVMLYASPWSPVEKASVPANYELRFNFVVGTIPADPRAPQAGYAAHMGVRLWDKEARAWGESSMEVPVGQPVEGKKLKFKIGAATKACDLSTGLVFDSVRTATRFGVDRIKEPLMETKTDENGETVNNPVLDESGQPKSVEKLVPQRVATQVAIFREGDKEKLRLIKGMGYEAQIPAGVRILLEGEPEPDMQQLAKEEADGGKPADTKTKATPEKPADTTKKAPDTKAKPAVK